MSETKHPTVAEAFKSLNLEKLTIGPDGRLKLSGEDLINVLKDKGVQLPDGKVFPRNNDHGCNNIC